jgi:hemerythrin
MTLYRVEIPPSNALKGYSVPDFTGKLAPPVCNRKKRRTKYIGPVWEEKMAQWIPWLSHFNVNVPSIDRQHKELFRMFNELCDAIWDGKGKDHIGSGIKFLADYTVQHFADEEAYMKEYDFPAYLEHKKAHDDFVEDVSQFIGKFETEDVGSDLVISVITKLGQWTRDHIRGMDQELGSFLVTRGINAQQTVPGTLSKVQNMPGV